MLFASCGNGDNALEEIINGGGSGGGSTAVTEITIDLTAIADEFLNDQKTQLKLKVGDEVTLSFNIKPAELADTEVTLTPEDPTIVSIDGKKVKALKEGTTKVTAKAGDKSAICTVTVQYAANEYNEGEWDGTKVVFTKKTAASVTAMTNTTTTWNAGWYTVSGNVTITGNVELTADAHLILQDGAKLTITGQLNGYADALARNLYIYGQSTSDGKLIVENNSGTAIQIGNSAGSGKDIEIHGGEITAKATGVSGPGIYSKCIRVYGGKLTAESNATMGIQFGMYSGSNNFEVYGGEVYATSLKTSGHGISETSTANDVLMVYGGKVNGTGGTGGQGFKCKLWSATTGIKFYFSDNGTTWGSGLSYGIAASALDNRYAKAE
jgi:hypothetical protein